MYAFNFIKRSQEKGLKRENIIDYWYIEIYDNNSISMKRFSNMSISLPIVMNFV